MNTLDRCEALFRGAVAAPKATHVTVPVCDLGDLVLLAKACHLMKGSKRSNTKQRSVRSRAR